MGMYTELVMASEIKNDQTVIDILRVMIGEKYSDDLHFDLPDHPLFKSEDQLWKYMLRIDSYYFSGTTHATLEEKYLEPVSPSYYLTIRCNFKNYGNEIQKFLDWLSPYIEDIGFIGYYRYEENGRPTLIFHSMTKGIIYDE